jgi:hypothetical protein
MLSQFFLRATSKLTCLFSSDSFCHSSVIISRYSSRMTVSHEWGQKRRPCSYPNRIRFPLFHGLERCTCHIDPLTNVSSVKGFGKTDLLYRSHRAMYRPYPLRNCLQVIHPPLRLRAAPFQRLYLPNAFVH